MEESDFKKIGLEVYSYYWIFPIFILFLIINFFVPLIKIPTLDIELMISIVTFLFGFLISISFSMILSRVSVLKESLAIETGRFISLFLLSKNLGKKFEEKIAERIDRYTILTMRNYSDYSVGREEFYGIYEDIKDMELKTEMQKQISSSFFYVLGELEFVREKLEYLTNGKLLPAMKVSNYALGFILVALLFLNRGDSFTNSLFVILSTIILFILFIIEDYEDLRIGDYVSNISNSEQLFDIIGKERYYPKFLLKRAKLEKDKNYRIGIYDKTLGKEEIFKLKYSPGFDFKIEKVLDRFKKKKEKIESF